MDTSKDFICDCNPCDCTNCVCGRPAPEEQTGCACGPECGCSEACACVQSQ